MLHTRVYALPIVIALLLLRMHAFGQDSTFVDFVSSNLPIVIIDTHGQEIPDDPKITADMGIIYNGPGVRNSVTDSFNVYNGKIGIEIRGFSSQQFPKLQYAVETRDAFGEDLAVSLLGMPAEADWVLSAGYSDKTLMRNALAYDLANSSGRYASRSRFCELVLNGEYRGVYVLFEKIKRDKNRVNITKMAPTNITGDALTGGYIVKIDRVNNIDDVWWVSPFAPYPDSPDSVKYVFVYPKPEDIVDVQKTYIQNFITSFEASMADSNFADTTNGYVRYLDRSSAVDYFLINEMARNVDSYRASFYMYKDRDSKGGKLVLGPVWDFDIAFGNVFYSSGDDTAGWDLITMPPILEQSPGEEQIPFWWNRLASDSTFWYAAGNRWAALRKTVFTQEAVFAVIDSLAAYLDEAKERNFQRWPILSIYVWPNVYIGGSYANEIAYLKKWIADRMVWMDNALPPPRIDLTLHAAFSSVTAQAADSIVSIDWKTAHETNTTFFAIQRKRADTLAQDTSWQTIGTLIAADTSSVTRSYAYTDTLHASGDLSYRLELFGKTGQSIVSPTVPVRVVLPADSLRIALQSFTASTSDTVVTLHWETRLEEHTTIFEVQRRTSDTLAPDTSWHTIGAVQAAETSSVAHSYHFIDSLLVTGGFAYRLKIDGALGQWRYSPRVDVQFILPRDTLRVLFSSFSAQANPGTVNLSWITTKEANTIQFDVERRLIDSLVQNAPWLRIGTVHAAETSSVNRSYAFADTLHGVVQAAYRLRTSGKGGQYALSSELIVRLVGVPADAPAIPKECALSQNYPNPFNPTTKMRYSVGVVSREGVVAARVRLAVYDLLGREVAVLVDERKEPGNYQVEFDATPLPSGVYIYRLTAGQFVDSKRMLLLK